MTRPSRKAFEECDLPRLREWINSGELAPGHLTFAAETYGKRAGSEAAELLLELLRHPSPMVREGAVYGVAEVIRALVGELHELHQRDPSEGVRMAAAEAIDIVKEEP